MADAPGAQLTGSAADADDSTMQVITQRPLATAAALTIQRAGSPRTVSVTVH